MGVDSGTQGSTACGRAIDEGRGGEGRGGGVQDRDAALRLQSPYACRFMTRLRAHEQQAQVLVQWWSMSRIELYPPQTSRRPEQ